MSPFRLLILLFLLYILFRLLFSRSGKKRLRPEPPPPPKQDVLVEDPVCHIYVPQQQAVSLKQNHHTYYFCSTRCRDRFLAEKGE